MATQTRRAEEQLTIAQIDKRLTVYARQLERGSAHIGVTREEVLLGADHLLDLRLELTQEES